MVLLKNIIKWFIIFIFTLSIVGNIFVCLLITGFIYFAYSSYKKRKINKLSQVDKTVYKVQQEKFPVYDYIYNLDELPSQFSIIDIETTGLDPLNDEMIEIAILKCVNGQITDKFVQLIKPDGRIPSEVTKINGITNRMVKGQPKIDQVIGDIYERIKNEKLIVGYNIKFDLDFISAALLRNGLSIEKITVYDVLDLVKETLINDIPNRKLETVKNFFGIDTASHRALDDCMVTLDVFKRCLELKKDRENKLKEEILTLNENEQLFINTLIEKLKESGINKRFEFNVLSDKVINFTIDRMQIGRVKLRGRKYKMQLLDRDNVIWIEIEDVSEAINNIKHWIKYAKTLK